MFCEGSHISYVDFEAFYNQVKLLQIQTSDFGCVLLIKIKIIQLIQQRVINCSGC
jgi:hypothetical protein